MKYKVNSTAYKIENAKEYLQSLIDTPYEKWKPWRKRMNMNKPIYVTKNIIVDIIENEVIVGLNGDAKIDFDEIYKRGEKH